MYDGYMGGLWEYEGVYGCMMGVCGYMCMYDGYMGIDVDVLLV